MNKLNFENIDKKKIVMAVLLVIAVILQFTFLSYLFQALTPEEEQKNKNIIMSYTSSGNFDYKVYLKPNDFIKEPYLGPNEAYILDLIDHIKINSLYKFSATEKTNVTGTSKVIARLKVYYRESGSTNNNPEILKKEKILEEREVSFDETSYNTLGSYDIYLQDYLKTLKDFQSQVKISVEGYLEISSETNLNGTVSGASYKDKYVNTIKIPLSSSVIKIDNPKQNKKTNNIYTGDILKTNKLVMSFIIILNIATFAAICLLLRKLLNFQTKSEYDKELEKILKNYDDIIVNTQNVIDVSKYKVIEIDEFKEILNLSRELLLPIMNYEVVKDKATWFYVLKDDILYKYVISERKLETLKRIQEKIKLEQRKENSKYYDCNTIGADVVGTKDYFGPIIATACYVSKEDISFLEKIGADNANNLSDSEIKTIAPEIASKIKYRSVILNNKEYNEKYPENVDINRIRAILQNKVLYQLTQEEQPNMDYIISNRFTSETKYYDYLTRVSSIQKDVTFTSQTENINLAVACSYIISRYLFLQEFDNLCNENNLTLPTGVGTEVNKTGRDIVEKYGQEKLKDVAKFNFINTEFILRTPVVEVIKKRYLK